uniref:Calcium uniporter protein C-terminal domain-containing protein n=1 Tax=Oryza meridionalis TaxID=40149 RepID=A0A0E0EZK5_9ORYZ
MAAALMRRAARASPAACGLRRFMQEQTAFRPAERRGFIPLADRIRDLGAAFPRINLDGLVPPAPPQTHPTVAREERASASSAVAGLTVEEARKVLRATQMEAARARLRASGAGTVPYAEFLRLCCDAAGAESGASVARALDESGSVIVLGKTVFLRPEMVVKAIEKAIPIPRAQPIALDGPAREELKAMEAQKVEIDRTAALQVRRELWLGLAYLVVQTAGFMRLTFWELSWDVMEPICFYVTSMYFMAGYTFFLRTKKEPSFEGFFESRFAAKQKRLMHARDFDLRRYDELRRACGLPVVRTPTNPCKSSSSSSSSSSMQESHCHSYCHCQ